MPSNIYDILGSVLGILPSGGPPSHMDGTTNTDDTDAMLQWLQQQPNKPGLGGPMGPAPGAPQSSPFQSAMEQAIMAELKRPPLQPPQMITEEFTPYGQKGNLAALVAAGGQNANQQLAIQQQAREQKLAALMGGYGHANSANADMIRSQAMAQQARTGADELAYKQSPEGQAFAFKMSGVPENSPQIGIQRALGLTPGVALPADIDEFSDKYVGQGGQPIVPGSDLDIATNQLYGENKTKRLAGERLGWTEPLDASLSGWLGLSTTGTKAAKARKAFGVGVSGAASTAKPGVQFQEAPVRMAPTILSQQERDAERARRASKTHAITNPS